MNSRQAAQTCALAIACTLLAACGGMGAAKPSASAAPMARAALISEKKLAAKDADKSFHQAKIATARFYADHVLVQAPALRNTVVNGAAGVLALSEDPFLAG